MPKTEKPPRGKKEKQAVCRGKTKKKLYIHCAVDMKQPHATTEPKKVFRAHISGLQEKTPAFTSALLHTAQTAPHEMLPAF